MSLRDGNSIGKTEKDRNYGIDLLRMVSMYMVIILHVLSFGGVISSVPVLSVKYDVAWFLEMASYGAVNMFAITSGYVHYGRKTKYAAIIQLYFQILFYTVLTTAVFLLFFPDLVYKRTILYALLPYHLEGYWYFTSFFCLSFFMPFIDRLIDRLDRKNAARLLMACFVVFSLLTTLLMYDIGRVNLGYSLLWLAVMYTVGACIKKYDFNIKQNTCLKCYLICVAASLAGKLAVESVTYAWKGAAEYGDLFSRYISPFIVISSVSLFLFFKNLKLHKTSISLVKFFAPATFGVYIIHLEPLLKDMFITDRFSGLTKLPEPFLICGVRGVALVIWFVCSMADRVRLEIFNIFKIQTFCQWIEKKIKTVILSKFRFLAE